MAASKKVALGHTGETVRENVRRLRTDQNLTYAALSRRLDDIGRPIATLGLSRIENGERRVDADDLVAIALALRTSPTYLLMPEAETEHDIVASTAMDEVTARELWDWLVTHRAGDPLQEGLPGLVEFKFQRPAWTHKEGTREDKEAMAQNREVLKLLEEMTRRGDT